MKHGLRIAGFWPLLGILVVGLVIIHWNWIFSFAPLQSADWPYFYTPQMKEWFPWHPLWITYDGLGRGISQGNFTLLFSIYGLLAQLGANFELISRMLFFWPVLICTPLASYLAVKEITGNKVAAVIGAFVYSLNTYFIVIQAGHMHISVTYALAPFVYYFAAKKGRRSFFWFYIFLAIISVYDIRMALVIGLFGSIIAYFHKARHKNDIGGITKKLFIGAICLGIFSLYWILPMHYTAGGPFTRDVFDQQALNWISTRDAFSIHHPFWSSEGVTDFVFAPAPFYMYALPILAFTPFALPRKSWDGMNRVLLFYGLIGIASIILLMQENSLLAGLYKLIYDNLPLMSMFRESSKMFFITSFCYSVLIGFLLIELHKRKEARFGKVVIVLIVFIVLAPVTPYLTGNYIKTYKKEPIQADIQKVNQIVNKAAQTPTRTLWVSRTPEFANMADSIPSVDAADFGSKYWNKYANPFAGQGITFLGEANAPTLLKFAGVQHVVVPPDDADSNFHHYDNKPASHYENLISAWNLKEQKSVNKYRIWNVGQPKPHMYFSTNTIAAESVSSYSGIDKTRTSAYLFKDQNNKVIDALTRATNNTEHTVFQAKYSDVSKGKVVSNFHPQESNDLTLYTLNQQSQKREFVEQSYKKNDVAQVNDEAIAGVNLYRNGAFESKESVKVGDCNNSDKSNLQTNGISAVSDKDAIEGKQSLRVSAKKHIACFFNTIPRYNSEAYYMISFSYKYISGKAPYVALYPFREEPAKRQTSLRTDKKNEWLTFQTVIKPGQFLDDINVNLYVPTKEGVKSEVLFDDMRVYEVPFVPEAYARTNSAPTRPIETTSLESSNVRHSMKVNGLTSGRLLVFSETFDPNWQATLHNTKNSKSYVIPAASHMQANGFANSWWIDPADMPASFKDSAGDYIIMLDYTPQKWANIGAVIAGLVVLGAASYLVIDVVLERKMKSGARHANATKGWRSRK